MDFITRLPKTKGGHDAIAIFVDRLTKIVRLAPTTTEVSVEGSDKPFGPARGATPSPPLFDSVQQRCSVHFKVLSALDCSTGNPDQNEHCVPSTDGWPNRSHDSGFGDYLRSYTRSDQDTRDELLAMAEFAMNNSKNNSINKTPFYLNYSCHLKSPLALGVEIWKPMKGYGNPSARGLAVAINRAQQPKLRQNGKPSVESVPAVICFGSTYPISYKRGQGALAKSSKTGSQSILTAIAGMFYFRKALKPFSQQRTSP